MSVKKLLVLGAASLVAISATAVLAGGPDHMAMPAEPAFQNSVYIDGHIGYAQSNWNRFNSNNVVGVSTSSLFTPTSNGKGGFTGGLDLGYTITRHIAIEGGWFYIPQIKAGVTSFGTGIATSGLVAGNTAKINSWFAYAAAKLSVPVMENFDLFGKVGVAYRALTYSAPAALVSSTYAQNALGNGHYWAPLFAAGMQYNWGDWALGGQYTYLPGDSEINYGNVAFGAPNSAPEVNLYTAFLGYRFNV